MKTLIFTCSLLLPLLAIAQVSTETEVNTATKLGEIRPGYYIVAKPYEITMTINLWGEVPLQGLYVVPIKTDIVQLLSYSGGPKEKSDLEDVLIYRVLDAKKNETQRSMIRIDVSDIVRGKSQPVVLQPGDMVVVKRIPDSLHWLDIFTIATTITSVLTLFISAYALSKQ